MIDENAMKTKNVQKTTIFVGVGDFSARTNIFDLYLSAERQYVPTRRTTHTHTVSRPTSAAPTTRKLGHFP